MRVISATFAAALALLACSATGKVAETALASVGHATGASAFAERSLTRALNKGMQAVGSYSGAYVLDLNTGRTLYSDNARRARLPASVEKLYTTSAALIELGPSDTLTTSVLGVGRMESGTFAGTLYLRGGGDPTFGSAAFDRANYGAGATVQRLVANLISATRIRALNGGVVADESMFDSRRGTPATGYAPSIDIEGELSALAFNRGWANPYGSVYFKHPALAAGQQLLAALGAAGVRVGRRTHVRAGVTPSSATRLAAVHSPPVAGLVALTNTPSDNFLAETLLKDLGVRYGAGGTTANGAAVVRATIASRFGLHPRFDDGSGLSRYDRTSPLDVVSLLRQQADDPQFTGSLAVAGRTGTLRDELRGTYAQGRCRGKTGTLHDVSNVVGYCLARDGHTLAYALLMNGVYPYYAHPIQNQMQLAMAKYGG